MNSSRKLMNLSARQLHAFLEIGRLKSFARAAEQVHLSPSGMSMLVKELEEQVGARLFDRTTRAVTLTEVGLRLQPVAERIVQDVRGLGDVVEGTQAAVRQRLQRVETDAIPMAESAVVEHLVGPRRWWNPFPLVRFTERPDVAAATAGGQEHAHARGAAGARPRTRTGDGRRPARAGRRPPRRRRPRRCARRLA